MTTPTPSKGRIVLFHTWRAPEEAAALVTGVNFAADGQALVNLQVFHDDGSMMREVDVPYAELDDAGLGSAASAWRAWDKAQDEARDKGADIPATPHYPQRSWRWPPRQEGKLEAGLRKMDDTLGSLRGGAQAQQVAELERLEQLAAEKRAASLEAAEASGRQWFRDGKTLQDPVPLHVIPDDDHANRFALGFGAADTLHRRLLEMGASVFADGKPIDDPVIADMIDPYEKTVAGNGWTAAQNAAHPQGAGDAAGGQFDGAGGSAS
jgi:hypothetical protein